MEDLGSTGSTGPTGSTAANLISAGMTRTSGTRRPEQPLGESIALTNVNNSQEGNPGSSDLRPEQNASDTKPTSRKRLARLSIAILIIGPAASFGALGFLAFLWIGSHRARNGLSTQQLWFDMLDSNWILRAIPFVTLVLRTAISMEAGIATSMLAAVLIERPGVRLSRLAPVSVLRSTDSPPYVLAWNARGDVLTPPLHVLCCLLVILLITTSAIQLSSNILLFDFADAVIPRFPTKANATIPFSYSANSGPTKYVNRNQAAYLEYSAQFPRFAEYSQPPIQPGPGQERDFRDTGVVYRAFIPLSKDLRQLLRQYSGPATVLNAQVVCARPTISRFAVSSPQIPGRSQIRFANLTYSLNTPAPLLESSIDMFAGRFAEAAKRLRNISMPVTVSSIALEDPDPDPGPDTSRGTQETQWPMSIASYLFAGERAFLLFNWTGSLTDWSQDDDNASPDAWVSRRDRHDEWATVSHRTKQLSFDMTLCFTLFNSTPYLIETMGMGEAATVAEPEIAWDSTADMLSTANATKYLSPPDNTGERPGILAMGALRLASEIPKNYTGYKSIGVGASVTEQVILAMENVQAKLAVLDPSGILFGQMRWAAVLCYDINLDSYIGLHSSFIAVFQAIIQHTRDPAVAVQALLTMATANAYVELQPYFDFELPAQYSVWAQAFVPTHWTGFTAVAAAIVVHTLAVAAVAALFLRETRYTELGNAWQAVAQLVTNNADDNGDMRLLLLPSAARDTSSVFKKRLREGGRDVRYRVVVGEEDSPHLERVD
ncbi:hypothetical protein B0H67DRAFT_557273 [Lasiosphaeris hirsuta]|uniref:Transmembrane protein n=1 Tax=Lasiosphaeris hirsuta TaxID=260670 RepID=A0AA39ZVR2_9PEZI|nr:hypothetical protein B0H67DRAFT_557273 [Lasiosphaeris hirsuta]